MSARSTTGAGFTIVEVMIFLAISGLMFVLAVNAMGGKQQQTEFTTGVDTFRSELNQNLSDVRDGNYQAIQHAYCTAGSSGAPNITTTPPSDGTCTIIGEVIAFTTGKSYTVFPVFGRTYAQAAMGTGSLATNLTEAIPTLGDPTNSVLHAYQTVNMPFGLTIEPNPSTPMVISSGGNGSIGVVGFTSFEGGNSTGTTGSLSSGAEHVEIFAIPTTTINDTPAVTAAKVNGTVSLVADTGLINCGANDSLVCVGPVSPSTINPSGGITLCLNSGTDNESAEFIIGGVNSPTSATDQVYDKQGCTN